MSGQVWPVGWDKRSDMSGYDAASDARSEARYEDDPRIEDDSEWRETLPEKGCA